MSSDASAGPAPFRLYSTLSRTVEDFEPLVPGRVSLYVCGMTVYDDAHVGHARAMVVFDTVVRYLRHRGWDVRFVRNFTDVDDKIIDRACERGEDPAVLASRYIEAFERDANDLGLVPPTCEPCVTESIAQIVAMIGELVARGHAYENEGSVWFAVDTCEHYGELSGQKVDQLRSADVGTKRSPADFALWKAAKPGEPWWDSPWGPGRPGWHIECSAMARTWLGEQIDIHGGGLDLVFPHHENEIAQSESATGARPFARYWMHNGLLLVTGGPKVGFHGPGADENAAATESVQKMGKSLGNAIQVNELLRQFPAEALRLYYLQTHYRSPLPWNEAALPDALAMLARLYDAREVAESMGGDEDPARVIHEVGRDAKEVWDLAHAFPVRFHAAMDDDFNTAMALGHAFELARAVNRLSNAKVARKRGGPVVRPALAALELLSSIGLLGLSTTAFQDDVKDKRLTALRVDRATIDALVAERAAARAAKDWTRADALRAELDAKGIVVMDRADGVDWRVRLERHIE